MAINLLPIIIIGGAIAALNKKKRPKRKVLPQKNDRGVIFEGDSEERPSGIFAKVGERFSVSFYTSPSIPGEWSLKASPPDDSIKYIKTEHDMLDSGDNEVGGPTGKDIYIFEGIKPGKGSLVFHWQKPWLEGEAPPEDVVEILTKIGE